MAMIGECEECGARPIELVEIKGGRLVCRDCADTLEDKNEDNK